MDHEQKTQNFEQAYFDLLKRHTKLIYAYIARYGEEINFRELTIPKPKHNPFLSAQIGGKKIDLKARR